jgi:hypothetical protein
MSDSLATFFTAVCSAMESMSYHYSHYEIADESSSVVDKSFFVDTSLLGCDDESGLVVRKRRQITVNFVYACGAGGDKKTQALAANTELELVEDAILSACKYDWLQLDNMNWDNSRITFAGFLVAKINITATYWRQLT